MTTDDSDDESNVESDLAIHPGEFLGEEIAERGMTQRALAASIERSAQVVNEIVRGKKSITADTALALELALGISARTWLSLQVDYDLTKAIQRRAARAI
jgi:addiction module HigA family antidote